jgi:drug/metabolite transporter (DMT)-like permease
MVWPGAGPVGAVVALAVLSTALAYLLFFRILARAGATAVSLVTFLVPLSAAGLGWVVLGERLTLAHLLGLR